MSGPALYASMLHLDARSLLTNLRTVVLGGEQLARSLAVRHASQAPHAALYNEYGPTETTVGCTTHQINPNDPIDDGVVVIGRPMDGVRMWRSTVKASHSLSAQPVVGS